MSAFYSSFNTLAKSFPLAANSEGNYDLNSLNFSRVFSVLNDVCSQPWATVNATDRFRPSEFRSFDRSIERVFPFSSVFLFDVSLHLAATRLFDGRSQSEEFPNGENDRFERDRLDVGLHDQSNEHVGPRISSKPFVVARGIYRSSRLFSRSARRQSHRSPRHRCSAMPSTAKILIERSFFT